MSASKLLAFVVGLFSISHIWAAEEHWASSNARQNGFVGCDKFIEEQVDLNKDFKIESKRFKDSKAIAYSFVLSIGTPGDNWIEIYDFHKSGKECFLSKQSIYAFNESCMVVKEKLAAFKTTDMHGDIAWTSNDKGVTGIFKSIGNLACQVVMRTGQSGPVSQ